MLITYCNVSENLWKSRKPPVPLNWTDATKDEDKMDVDEQDDIKNRDMKVWSIAKCAQYFESTVNTLKQELSGKEYLLWDKDDRQAMDFVTACANIRSHIFAIQMQSRFSTKCKCFQYNHLKFKSDLNIIFLEFLVHSENLKNGFLKKIPKTLNTPFFSETKFSRKLTLKYFDHLLSTSIMKLYNKRSKHLVFRSVTQESRVQFSS